MKNSNWREFERLVAIIQEALKDSPDTQILRNYKEPDRLGRLREFDVFIVTKANGFDIKIAIECKDYASAVSLEKVEAFNTKCSTIVGLNKKIMVSPKGFQKGVIENAKLLYDIDLYLLSGVSEDSVNNWIDLSGIRKLVGNIKVLKYWLKLNSRTVVEAGSENLPFLTKVTTDEGQIAPLAEIAYHTFHAYYEEISQRFTIEAYKAGHTANNSAFYLYDNFYIKGFAPNMWLEGKSGEIFYITEMNFFIEYSATANLPVEISIHDFNKHQQQAQANIVSVNFNDDKSSLNIVRNEGTGEVDAFFVDVNGNLEKLEGGLSFDTETGKITHL